MSGRTIVLVHGFRFRVSTHSHARHAARTNRTFALFEYDWSKSIVEIAELFHEWCRELHNSRRGELVIVAHSLGGLIATSMLQRFQPKFVSRLVTVATPHRGTFTAYIPQSSAACDMRPCSEFMNQHVATVDGYRHMNVIASNDWIVIPHSSCRLNHPNIHEVTIEGVGHLNLLTNMSVIRAIYSWLEDDGKQSETAV